ncbi:MAG: hypothetical protein HY721_05300 [Planctomycetes bacterium]|nr:hypothetical protein [Planctomycetota bacterium]
MNRITLALALAPLAVLRAGGVVPEGRIELRSAKLRAVVAGNSAYGPDHKAGYSGVAELSHAGSADLFVPAYSGLNFEHIFSGDAATYGRDIFEPRRAAMALHKVAEKRVELRQERTASWPLRTVLTYELAGEDAVDLTVACMPLEDAWKKHGYIGLFFASYVHGPEDLAIHFIARSRPGKGDAAPRWVRYLSAKHGEAACHRAAGVDWDPPVDPGFNIALAGGHSDLEYVHPFYYGVARGKAMIVMLERPKGGAEARFAQSPTGGGQGNPAWDFLFLKRGYVVGEEVRFRARLAVRDFRGREDVLKAYEAWSGEKVEAPKG